MESMKKMGVLLFAFLLFLSFASADMGPKPSTTVNFTYDGKELSDKFFIAKMAGCVGENAGTIYEDDRVKGELTAEYADRFQIPDNFFIEEKDEARGCTWKMARLAWVSNEAGENSRRFGYHPPAKFRLAVFIPETNKVFISKPATAKNFNSYFTADLKSDGSIDVQDSSPIVPAEKILPFIISVIMTIVIELALTGIAVLLKKVPAKTILTVLVANVISLPLVWFIFPLVPIDVLIVIIISEIFAVGFEAWFIHTLDKAGLTLRRALVLSTINNTASLLIGGFVLALLAVVLGIYWI